MDKLELPIGDASFRNIRTSGCYHVDKTPHLWSLAKGGRRYWFLSRPRRFGKSLLVDTLHELFAGSKELFEGLYIHDRWDWSIKNPLVRLSLNRQLLAVFSGTSITEVLQRGRTLVQLLADNDFAGLREELKALFAGIPYSFTAPFRGSRRDTGVDKQSLRWGMGGCGVRGVPSPHRISRRLRLGFFDSPSRGE